MCPSDDRYVRKVRLLMADRNLDDSGKHQCPPSYLDRPIHKLETGRDGIETERLDIESFVVGSNKSLASQSRF